MRIMRMSKSGWFRESYRHYLAAKRIKTKFRGEVIPSLTGLRSLDRDNRGVLICMDCGFPEDKCQCDYMARKVIEKKGKIHVTKSGAEVIAQANRIEKQIQPFVKKSEIVGSIRRKKENPVDVDIVVVPKAGKEDALKEKLKKESSKIYQEGERKFSGRINGIKTEVVFAKPEEYGAAVLTYTGSFGHNIGLRRIAQKKGLLLNEKGVFDRKTGKRLGGKTEREIYRILERPRFKGPEERN
jgi:DNA polymerase/3'-5' exonuclease PolX